MAPRAAASDVSQPTWKGQMKFSQAGPSVRISVAASSAAGAPDPPLRVHEDQHAAQQVRRHHHRAIREVVVESRSREQQLVEQQWHEREVAVVRLEQRPEAASPALLSAHIHSSAHNVVERVA